MRLRRTYPTLSGSSLPAPVPANALERSEPAGSWNALSPNSGRIAIRWSKISALDPLVVRPRRVVGEAVYLDGQTLRVRSQLAHEQRHVAMYVGVRFEVADDVGAERAHVRQTLRFRNHLVGERTRPLMFRQMLLRSVACRPGAARIAPGARSRHRRGSERWRDPGGGSA